MTIQLHVDSSIDTKHGGRDMLVIDAAKRTFQIVKDRCCKEYDIGCDVILIFDDQTAQPIKTPQNGYKRKDYDRLAGKITANGKNLVTIPVLFTNKVILDNESVGGVGNLGNGSIVTLGGSLPEPGTMAHEIGHNSGYYQLNYVKERNESNPALKDIVDKDKNDPFYNEHSNLKNSVMYHESSDTGVDKCYCRKVFGVHFFPEAREYIESTAVEYSQMNNLNLARVRADISCFNGGVRYGALLFLNSAILIFLTASCKHSPESGDPRDTAFDKGVNLMNPVNAAQQDVGSNQDWPECDEIHGQPTEVGMEIIDARWKQAEDSGIADPAAEEQIREVVLAGINYPTAKIDAIAFFDVNTAMVEATCVVASNSGGCYMFVLSRINGKWKIVRRYLTLLV